MRFHIGERIVSDRVHGVGLIVRTKKLRGLYLVKFSRNVTAWIDEDDLRPAPPSMATAPILPSRGCLDAGAYRKLATDRAAGAHAAVTKDARR